MKKIEAVFADIDGTLTVKGGKLMPETRKQLIRLHEQGTRIGLATGRPVDRRIMERAARWELPFEFDAIIGLNGGELWTRETRQTRNMHMLAEENVLKILQILKDQDVNCVIYRDGYDDVVCTRLDKFIESSMERNSYKIRLMSIEDMASLPAGKVEVQYDAPQHEALMKHIEAHPDPAWITVATFIGCVEFMDPAVSKGNAMRMYADQMGIDPANIIAFGDMDNDISMLEAAGYGVCLANGSDVTKAAADAVTEYTVEEDGVGRFLSGFIPETE